MTVRIRASAAVLVVCAIVAVIGLYVIARNWVGDLNLGLPPERECTVDANGHVTLDAEQMANAATIAAVGIRHRMPERGVVVALATAFQESKLHNIAHGDRDSLGLFQQRPSKGWGTAEQIQDPRYAARRFYDALRKVRGWEKMRVTDAAQRVQRSAFPEAYEKWADEATVLTRALLGNATGAVACTVSDTPSMRGTAAATALQRGLQLDWGTVKTARADVVGLTVSVADARSGWRYAHWLVSHAAAHGLKRVHFADLEWTAKEGTWVKADASAPPAATVVAEVFDDDA
ncbi:MAG TPA: hypothetical protein VFR67_31585 [Pilimelia sp.]|nr:hypothetical protein [Pilimelia sp.]